MNTLGIRVKPDCIVIALYDSENKEIINVETIKIPKALAVPEALKYIRNTVLDILREYEVETAGLRIVESNSQNLNISRIEIEGVIQEAFASSLLNDYYCGQISTIASKLKIPREKFKKFVSGELDYDSVENWNKHSKEEKEAILTAIGATHA